MKFLIILITSLCSGGIALAQTEVQRINHFNTKKNIAVEGYDVTTYFDNKPTEGSPEFMVKYKGITYLFASKENLRKFSINATMYEPVYGGWCAYAMGDSGEKV